MSENFLRTDPRPVLSGTTERPRLAGWRCSDCRHPLALPAPWCPLCRGGLVAEEFGPHGSVWSSTVLRVPLPGRTPPQALVYVDLDDGPRVLGHLDRSSDRVPIGSRLTLHGTTPEGDLRFGLTPMSDAHGKRRST
ncbi:Zn-ribbon domain-containing OB-fold protein [Rhodococcus oxybenzonivorans]|uniref:Zn-ribbon domain-containing OB-fold protein n=1 Tax=Rhodococcus oxybenzonivorans TaxID=1990687 RepID=UPI0037C85F23